MATVKTARAGDDVICLICKDEIAGQYMVCFRRVNAHPLHLECFEQFMASSLRKECPACKGAIPTLPQVRAAAVLDKEANRSLSSSSSSSRGASAGASDARRAPLRDVVRTREEERTREERSALLSGAATSYTSSTSTSGWMTSRRRVSAQPPPPPTATLELVSSTDSEEGQEEEEEEEEVADSPLYSPTSPAYAPTSPAYAVAQSSVRPPLPPPLPLPPQAAPDTTSVTSASLFQRIGEEAAVDLHDWNFEALPPTPARLREILPTTTGERFRQDVARSMRTLYVQLYNAVDYQEELIQRCEAAVEEADDARILVAALTRRVRELEDRLHRARQSRRSDRDDPDGFQDVERAREDRRRTRDDRGEMLRRTRPRM